VAKIGDFGFSRVAYEGPGDAGEPLTLDTRLGTFGY